MIEKIKQFLILFFKRNIKDEEIIELIETRLEELMIVELPFEEFKEYYNNRKTTAFLPSAFYDFYKKTIFVHDGGNYSNPKDLAKLIHEILHHLSNDKNGKIGFLQIDSDNNTWYGEGIDEAATSNIASTILNVPFVACGGYTEDYLNTMNLIRALTDLSQEEYFLYYFKKTNWLDEDIERRFNSTQGSGLREIVYTYDLRRTNSFDANLVLNNFLLAINNKKSLNTDVTKFKNDFSKLFNYYVELYEVDIELQEKIAAIFKIEKEAPKSK